MPETLQQTEIYFFTSLLFIIVIATLDSIPLNYTDRCFHVFCISLYLLRLFITIYIYN